ncbi:MAG: molybdopterin converting factor [Planctomycetaceae bacterium]|nr:molybdopterin converting factor [Planctomycetaceae bacterium]
MKILFINNDGSGIADQIDITEGLTVSVLFEQRVPHGRPQNYLIWVYKSSTSLSLPLSFIDSLFLKATCLAGGLLKCFLARNSG